MKILYRLKARVTSLTNFYVFDVETGTKNTNGSIQWELNARPESFQFGVIYGHNYSKVIYSIHDFILLFQEPRFKNATIFAHNATYDLTTLFGNIFDLDNKAVFVGSRFISCTNGNCKFADSMNIVKSSVAKMGELIGVAKPSLGDNTLFSPNGITADEINRCYTDCHIVWTVLFQIFTFAGNIKITQASLAMHYFRANHLPFNIEANDYTKHFWDSYYGGRTEAFKIGQTNAMVIDVNSMYPYVMRETAFPNPKNLKSFKPALSDMDYLFTNFCGVAYAKVKHRPHWFGFLPVKTNGKLCFPIGTFSGCWNFNELQFAVNSGYVEILTIDKVVYSEPMQSPFIDFVNTLYKMRVESKDELEIYRIKIFLNSLYGKFAQRIENETVYIKDIRKQLDQIQDYQRNGLLVSLDYFNPSRNDCFLTVKRPIAVEPSFAIPSFASYITSAARIVLMQKLKDLENCKPVYCDTDSIFFEVNNGVKSEYQLGGWKIENKIITEIRGLKNYSETKPDGKIFSRIKGIPFKSKIIAPNTYEYFNLLQTKEALRRNLPAGVKTRREKVISNLYDKRIVLNNGETKPIEI